MKKAHWILIAVLILLFGGTAMYRTHVLGLTPERVIPQHGYKMELELKVRGHHSNISMSTFLPQKSFRQKIFNEKIQSKKFNYSEEQTNFNRRAIWKKKDVQGLKSIRYNATLVTKKAIYNLPQTIDISTERNPNDSLWLSPTPLIQSQAPEIKQLVRRLGLNHMKNLRSILKTVYLFSADSLAKAGFSAETDALLALKLREASCNGKSRLAVALFRNLNIPARLVGGIIMRKGSKKTTHQWLEVKVGNQWVPIDPLNHHFAELPRKYLVLYRGDKNLFTRTANSAFKYRFTFTPVRIHLSPKLPQNVPAWADPWKLFRNAGISVDIFRVLMMIPFGALLTVIFRNVIGLSSFGTFLPVLIAAAYRDTGLWWGHAGFISLILLGSVIRFFLDKLKLLHSPKLTVILVFIILGMLSLTALGIESGISALQNGRLYPIAILAITSERFGLMVEERGWIDTLKTLFNTLIVVTFCYLGMLSEILQMIAISYPEIQLLVIAGAIYLGRWTGIRLSEYWRFRHYLRDPEFSK